MRCSTSRPRRPRWRLMRVGGIGHELQFAQDELRDEQDAVEEMSLANIGDAAVDDHAGVQHFGHSPGAAFAAEQAAQRLQVQHVSLIGPDHQADVGHHQEQPDVQKGPRTLRDRRPRQDQPHQVRAENAENRADRGPDQAAHAGALQANLKQEDGNGKREANPGGYEAGQAERVKMVSRRHARGRKDGSDQHVVPPASELGSGLRRGCRTKRKWSRWRRRNGRSWPGKRTVHKASFLMRRQKNKSITLAHGLRALDFCLYDPGADLGRKV